MSIELIGRVLERIRDLGMNPRSASLASGLNPTFIRDLMSRPNASPSARSLQKLAAGLQTTPSWLAFGTDQAEGEAATRPVQSGKRPTGLPSKLSSFVEAAYGGKVEAGSWREVDDVDDPDRAPEVVPRDDRFPRERYVIFEVVGDSMNAADPPMPEGCRVLAVAADDPTRPIPLRNGDLVVIQRKRAQGGLIERSVKEIEMGDEVTRYRPRSTNPKHKPIVYGIDPDDEDESVEVLGLVIDVMHRVRRR